MYITPGEDAVRELAPGEEVAEEGRRGAVPRAKIVHYRLYIKCIRHAINTDNVTE